MTAAAASPPDACPGCGGAHGLPCQGCRGGGCRRLESAEGRPPVSARGPIGCRAGRLWCRVCQGEPARPARSVLGDERLHRAPPSLYVGLALSSPAGDLLVVSSVLPDGRWVLADRDVYADDPTPADLWREGWALLGHVGAAAGLIWLLHQTDPSGRWALEPSDGLRWRCVSSTGDELVEATPGEAVLAALGHAWGLAGPAGRRS